MLQDAKHRETSVKMLKHFFFNGARGSYQVCLLRHSMLCLRINAQECLFPLATATWEPPTRQRHIKFQVSGETNIQDEGDESDPDEALPITLDG